MPALPAACFDDDAQPIASGARWGAAGAPEGAHQAVTDASRYAPLHDVADALVAHLLLAYECECEEDAAAEHELRAVLLRSAPGTASIRIAWTDFPGVRAHLGRAVEAAAPICGCDACDESLVAVAESLRDVVLTTAEGGLVERRAASGELAHRFEPPYGSGLTFARSDATAGPPARWLAWPIRGR